MTDTNHIEAEVSAVIKRLTGCPDIIGYGGESLAGEISRALSARASAGEGGDAAAWMIRNIHTGRFYWDEEECVFSDSSSAELYAEYLNDAYDSDPWEVVPLYTAAPQPAPSENES